MRSRELITLMPALVGYLTKIIHVAKPTGGLTRSMVPSPNPLTLLPREPSNARQRSEPSLATRQVFRTRAKRVNGTIASADPLRRFVDR
jgi:hypothetical protein